MNEDAGLAPTVRKRLTEIAGLEVLGDEASLRAAEQDFGGLSEGTTHAVVRPDRAEALLELVSCARAEGLSLTPRSLGLSQSGQSLADGGLSVDMNRLHEIDVQPEAGLVRCGAGATWREVVARTREFGLLPEVLPLNLGLSVGGILAAGGVGSTSHHYGMAVSSVDSLNVVTGAGELVLASPTQRSDVYDSVLGGIGRFGFICDAQIRLRPVQPRTRTYYLLYDDLQALVADERRLMAEPWCTHLEAFASAAMQGLKRGPEGRRIPFARWFFGLHVSTEFSTSEEPQQERCLRGLSFREHLHTEDNDSLEFPDRYELRFQMMKATGAWQQRHPWVECMVSADVAAEVLPDLFAGIPLLLGDGHRVTPIAEVPKPKLLMHPEGTPAIGVSVLPVGTPTAFEAPAIAALKAVHDRLLAAGGKRYLSGWLFEPDEAAWRLHYGEMFDTWQARKRELDPDGILKSRLMP